MKISVKFVFVLLVVVCVLLCIQLYESGKLKYELKEYKEKYNMEYCNVLDLQKNILFSYKYEDFFIDKNLVLEKEDSSFISLSEVVLDTNMLIVKFSELNCWTCVEELVNELDKLKQEGVLTKVVYIASCADRKKLQLIKSVCDISDDVYRLSEQYWTPDKENTPYLFVLTPQLEVRCLFAPLKDFPQMIHQYIDVILKKVDYEN